MGDCIDALTTFAATPTATPPPTTRFTVALFIDRLLQIRWNAALGKLRRNDAVGTRRGN